MGQKSADQRQWRKDDAMRERHPKDGASRDKRQNVSTSCSLLVLAERAKPRAKKSSKGEKCRVSVWSAIQYLYSS